MFQSILPPIPLQMDRHSEKKTHQISWQSDQIGASSIHPSGFWPSKRIPAASSDSTNQCQWEAQFDGVIDVGSFISCNQYIAIAVRDAVNAPQNEIRRVWHHPESGGWFLFGFPGSISLFVPGHFGIPAHIEWEVLLYGEKIDARFFFFCPSVPKEVRLMGLPGSQSSNLCGSRTAPSLTRHEVYSYKS